MKQRQINWLFAITLLFGGIDAGLIFGIWRQTTNHIFLFIGTFICISVISSIYIIDKYIIN